MHLCTNDLGPTVAKESNINACSQWQEKSCYLFSGPTSLDKNEGRGFIYLKNFDYFLEHGVSCSSARIRVDYILVLTDNVVKQYLSPDGLVTIKKEYCKKLFELNRA